MAHFMKEEAKFGKRNDVFKVEPSISKTPKIRAQVFQLVFVLLYTSEFSEKLKNIVYWPVFKNQPFASLNCVDDHEQMDLLPSNEVTMRSVLERQRLGAFSNRASEPEPCISRFTKKSSLKLGRSGYMGMWRTGRLDPLGGKEKVPVRNNLTTGLLQHFSWEVWWAQKASKVGRPVCSVSVDEGAGLWF